jgi:hypothetical protein
MQHFDTENMIQRYLEDLDTKSRDELISESGALRPFIDLAQTASVEEIRVMMQDLDDISIKLSFLSGMAEEAIAQRSLNTPFDLDLALGVADERSRHVALALGYEMEPTDVPVVD